MGPSLIGEDFPDASGEFLHRVWTRTDGLPDNRVQALCQTPDGYLWIGTRAGLARFDGLRFTVFTHASFPDLVADDVGQLVLDRDRRLCIAGTVGVHPCTLSVWDGNRFTYRRLSASSEGLSLLGPRQEGGVWLALSAGLYQRLGWLEGGKLEVGFASEADGPSVLLEEAGGRVWIGARGLDSHDVRTRRHVRYALPWAQDFGRVYGIHPAAQGGLVVLVARDPGSTPVTHFQVFHFDQGIWTPRTPRMLVDDGRSMFSLLDRRQNLWLPAGEHGLRRLRNGRLEKIVIPWGGAKGFPICMLEDREGSLWVGSETTGLHRLQPKAVQALGVSDGLAHDNTWCILQTRDQTLWVGADGGLSRVEVGGAAPNAGMPGHSKGNPANLSLRITTYTAKDGLARNDIRALAQDAAGTLWVGTGNGLQALQDGHFVTHRFPSVNPSISDLEGIGWNKVRALCPAPDGALWVGVARGLWRVESRQHAFLTDPTVDVANDTCLLRQTRDGALWAGRPNGGLSRLAPERLAALPAEIHSTNRAPLELDHGPGVAWFTRTNGLGGNSPYALHEDADGRLWVGTESGLCRLALAAPRAGGPMGPPSLHAFTAREGVAEKKVNCILEDDFANLWISCDYGICRVPRRELNELAEGRRSVVRCVPYDESDGMPTSETNGQKSQPAGWKTLDGRLWFPTPKGVVIIAPEAAIALTLPAPPVVIQQVVADGEIISDDDAVAAAAGRPSADPTAALRTSAVPVAGAPRLAPGRARTLEFRYTANTFIAPEKARFKYRLEGLETEWHEAGTRRVAYYSNLSPGAYCFRVRAANHHDVWSETGGAFAFRLAPFYYQARWFQVAATLTLAGVVYGVIRWRVRETRRLGALESEVALARERDRLAKDLHDGLGANLTRLSLLAEQAGRDAARPGAADEPLRELHESTLEMANSLKDLIWVTSPANETLAALMTRLCQQAEDFLRGAGIALRLDLPSDWPDRALSREARQQLLFVAKEALNNAAKHSGATEVRLRAAALDHTLTLRIQDNGRGLDPAQRPPGNGLRNMRERVAAIGGAFTLESQPGQGTTILVTLRLDARAGK